jgi:hypothetical protein
MIDTIYSVSAKALIVRRESVSSEFSAGLLIATKNLSVKDVEAHVSALLKP